VAPLGVGGMGEVYRARDTKLQREVAIKVLPERLARDPQALERFEREARAVAALSHPHILSIHDFGTVDGTAYAVMELLEGETLRDRLAGGALPIRKATEYAVQIADGLAAAHEKGIVHRDLKPENVFVTKDGRVKVLDFGLARQGVAPGADEPEESSPTVSRYTDPGTVLGTVGYMSPEQVRGQTVDHRADVFAFGAILYEMVSGARAFRHASKVETMNAILKEDPLESDATAAVLPPALERIIRHCLEKSPNERFQSARDLAFDLASLAGGATTSGRAALSATPRRRVPLALAAALASATAFGLGYLARAARHTEATEPRPVGQFSRLTEEQGAEQGPSLSPDGKTLLYVTGPAGNRDIWSRRVGGRNPTNLTMDCPRDDYGPAFSPDGEKIAFRSECGGGGIFVMGASGESAKRVTDFGYDPAWSPDGQRLVVATEAVGSPRSRLIVSKLWLVEAVTGARKQISAGDAAQPAWSPHGNRIAYWARAPKGGQRDLWTVAPDGSDPFALTNDRALDWAPVWSSDGSYLYFSSDRGGTMNLWRFPVDERSGRPRGGPEPVGVPAASTGTASLSGNGKVLAYASLERHSSVRTISMDDGRGPLGGTAKSVFTRSGGIAGIAWSPDGTWLVLNDFGRHEEIFLVHPDGTGYRQLVDDTFRNRFPRFSPDGTQIAFYSDRGGGYELWSIRPDGSGLQPITQSAKDLIYAAWAPDGKRLATFDTAGARILIVEVARPLNERIVETLPPLEGTFQGLNDLQWSPDGSTLSISTTRPDGTRVLFGYSFAAKTYRKLAEDAGSTPWFADSKRLLYSRGTQLVLLDTVSGASRDLLPTGMVSAGAGIAGAPSPDGRTLAFVEQTLDGDIWAMTLP
jgi:Tol biopolymer transport system component/tRNA A-37 threonylcarbamoyl transferase component Bud32